MDGGRARRFWVVATCVASIPLLMGLIVLAIFAESGSDALLLTSFAVSPAVAGTASYAVARRALWSPDSAAGIAGLSALVAMAPPAVWFGIAMATSN